MTDASKLASGTNIATGTTIGGRSIPHYRKALELGLQRADEANTRAWLASSLRKTGEPDIALQQLAKSRELDPGKSVNV